MIEALVREIVKKGVDKMPPGPGEGAKKQGEGIMHLDANENQYGPSPAAVRAMREITESVNTYPTPAGGELAEKLAAFHGLEPENIALGNGSSTILEKIGSVFLNPGDEVITCLPTFMIYIMIIEGCEAKPVICNLTEERSCRSMIPLIKEKNVIVTRTFSKIYGLAGARVGYAVANAEICRYLRSQIMMFNINKVGIAGACAALEDRQYYETCRGKHITDRKYMTEELTKLGFRVYESQASFLYMDPPAWVNVTAVNEALRARGVYTGMQPGNIRISLGTTEQNRYVIQCLKEILN